MLTHWGRVTHICIGKIIIIGSDNGLSPDRRQAIIWTNAGLLSIEPLWTYFSENLIKIQPFSLKKMHVKMSSAKWRPSCLGLNMLSLTLTHGYWNTLLITPCISNGDGTVLLLALDIFMCQMYLTVLYQTGTWVEQINIRAIRGLQTHISCLQDSMRPGPWFNIKMPSYQYRISHCGDKTIWWPSYLHNGISYTGKMTHLYIEPTSWLLLLGEGPWKGGPRRQVLLILNKTNTTTTRLTSEW